MEVVAIRCSQTTLARFVPSLGDKASTLVQVGVISVIPCDTKVHPLPVAIFKLRWPYSSKGVICSIGPTLATRLLALATRWPLIEMRSSASPASPSFNCCTCRRETKVRRQSVVDHLNLAGFGGPVGPRAGGRFGQALQQHGFALEHSAVFKRHARGLRRRAGDDYRQNCLGLETSTADRGETSSHLCLLRSVLLGRIAVSLGFRGCQEPLAAHTYSNGRR